MASPPFHRLVLLLAAVILVSIISTDAARPCRTIIFISSTSTSFSLNQNPNFHLQNPRFLNVYVAADSREINPNHFLSYKWSRFYTDRRSLNPPQLAGDVDSSLKKSIRESTLDIMSIVGALLFGVGSGAVTAAIMYLIWSMFSPSRFEFNADSDDDDAKLDF